MSEEKSTGRAGQARQKAEFILSRAYGMLRDPKEEWRQVKEEETNASSIMLGYVAPLAAIAPIAGVIGQLAFARDEVETSAGAIVTGAIVSYISIVALIFFVGILANAIAENFEASPHELNAIKLAAYAPTPWFLLSVISIFPAFWWVALFGLPITAFLIYRGLPILLRCPPDRAMAFTATLMIVGLVAIVILLALSSCFTPAAPVASPVAPAGG